MMPPPGRMDQPTPHFQNPLKTVSRCSCAHTRKPTLGALGGAIMDRRRRGKSWSHLTQEQKPKSWIVSHAGGKLAGVKEDNHHECRAGSLRVGATHGRGFTVEGCSA